jgi:hypothetical protein
VLEDVLSRLVFRPLHGLNRGLIIRKDEDPSYPFPGPYSHRQGLSDAYQFSRVYCAIVRGTYVGLEMLVSLLTPSG